MSIRIGIGLDIFSNRIDPEAQSIYNRIIAIPNGFSNLSRLNYFVKGLKAIYGTLSNVPVCYDAHWIGGVLGSGVGATAGQACARLCSLTVAGDAVQATASAQPLLLMHGGAASDNYWYGSGVNGNYVSTPNAAANQITGDIEINISLQLNDYSGVTMAYIAKDDGVSNRSLQYRQLSGGTHQIILNFGAGLVVYSTTVSAGLTNGIKYFLKVTRQSSNGNINFYKSTDGVSYTQIGATVSGTVGAMATINCPLEIASYQAGTQTLVQGKIYRVTISNTIGGAPVVDFNPAQYNASTSQTQWTSSTGEVWTINTGTATTGYKGVICDRIIVMSDGVDDGLLTVGNILSAMPFTMYLAFRGYVNNATGGKANFGQFNIDGAIGRNNATSILLWGGSPSTIYLTDTADSNKINMVTVLRKLGVNNTSMQINQNVAKLSNASGGFGADKIFIFTDSFGSDNSSFQTSVISSIEDTTQQKLAMYNLIRSLNNNAF